MPPRVALRRSEREEQLSIVMVRGEVLFETTLHYVLQADPRSGEGTLSNGFLLPALTVRASSIVPFISFR